MSHKNLLLVLVLGAIGGALLLFLPTRNDAPFGSVAVSNDYRATTTAASTLFGATISDSRLIRSGYGSLGSVVITGATAGVVNIYDATTTDALQRAGNKATSSIQIATLPASLAAGTYVFDAQYNDGL